MRFCAFLLPVALVACTPPTPEQAAQRCEERARAAAGPTGGLTIGTNSESGPYTSLEVGLSADYIAGRDPVEVYERCVRNMTGQSPIRPLNL